jgi:NAD dependent epimerase/dehydratase family enzyme
MAIPVRLGIGSAIGSGKQYFPWIHIEDLCNIFIKAIEDTRIKGAYNAAAPDQRINKEFVRTLAKVLKEPFWFPRVPAILMKLLLGEMSVILLTGSRISSEKIKKAGYLFIFPELEDALRNLLGKN